MKKVKYLFDSIKDLTGNFNAFKTSKSTFKIPSTSQIRSMIDATKELTFKPAINLNS